MSTDKKIIYQIIGWYGVLAILVGYALISFGVIPTHGTIYQTLMLTGSLSIILVASRKKDYQPMVLNIIFAIIAIISLILIGSGK